MTKQKILENVLSNWAGLVVGVIISFLVSPVVLHCLGTEVYGLWTLIVSVTGYFTVLDFGVNTAIVRYISSSSAQNDAVQARKIYSTSMAIFAAVAVVLMLFSFVFGFFFPSLFNLHHFPQLYIYAVFVLSAMDLAGGLLFSLFPGALSGLQEFKFINGSSIIVTVTKSALLVYLLKQGHGLLTLAFLQLCATLVRSTFQYWRIKTRHSFLYFSRDGINRDTVKLIYSYSVYSFIIAIALKLLFYTDSVVIGSLLGVAQVTYYAIPSSLLYYLEQLVWAMIAVLVPVISANEAIGEQRGNVDLYIAGTRYSLLVSLPIVISLFYYGDDFISLWMGPEIAAHSQVVLRLLLIGSGLAMSQLIAHGIMKGISKHKVLAYILMIEAIANLGISLALARPYGIEGVAFGTMVPLVIASLVIIAYTCHLLSLNMWSYLLRAYSGGAAGVVVALLAVRLMDPGAGSYLMLVLKSGVVTVAFMSVALPLSLTREHAGALLRQMKRIRNLKGVQE